MSTGGWQESEEPEIGARLLVMCREVRFDTASRYAPYTLHGLLSVLKPLANSLRSGTSRFTCLWNLSATRASSRCGSTY